MHSIPIAKVCRIVAATLALALSACSSVDQQAFDSEMQASIHEGMPASEAIRNLQDRGLACDLSRADSPKADCSRIQQHLLMSCVMRVTFTVDAISKSVRDLNIARIACAGL